LKNIKTSYSIGVTKTRWKWLCASITSKCYFKDPVITATFKKKCPKYPDTTTHFGKGIKPYKSGFEPHHTRPGGKYVNPKKRKFFSRFLGTKLTDPVFVLP